MTASKYDRLPQAGDYENESGNETFYDSEGIRVPCITSQTGVIHER